MTFLGTLVNGIGQGSLYALIAIGFSVVLSSSGVVDFARGQLVVVATLTTFSMKETHSVAPLLVLGVCLAVPAVVGVAEERIAVFPLRGDARASGWLVTTLGFGIVVQAITTKVFDGGSHGVNPPITLRSFSVGDIPINGYEIVVIGVAVAVTAIAWVVLRSTSAGRMLRAVAEDPEVAALRGINTRMVAISAFAVAGALAGLGGFVVASLTSAFVSQAPLFTIKGFIAMVAGGTGSIWGALLGGWLVGCAEQIGAHYIDAASIDLFGLAVLLVLLLLRPQGLFASRRLRSA